MIEVGPSAYHTLACAEVEGRGQGHVKRYHQSLFLPFSLLSWFSARRLSCHWHSTL